MSLFREGDSDQGNRIVDKDQQNSQDKSAGLASLFRRKPEWDAYQREHDAGGRQRQTAMIFDEIPAAIGGVCTAEKIVKLDLAERGGFVFLVVLRGRDLQRDVGGL